MKRTGYAVLLLLLRRIMLFLSIAAVSTTLIFLRAGAQINRGYLPTFHWNRYWPNLLQYLKHLIHGEFGYVYPEPPPTGGVAPIPPMRTEVGDLLWRAMPTSLTVMGCALVLGLLLGLLGGLLASRFARPWIRRTAQSANILILSLPDLLVIVFVQFGLIRLSQAVGFEVLPPYGNYDGSLTLRHAILPILMLSLFPAAYVARQSAAAFESIFGADFIRTARAKGLSKLKVTWGHALRNALVPIIASLPTVLGIMISNLVIVEYALDIGGVGRLLAWQLALPQKVVVTTTYPSPNLIASVGICLAALFVVIDAVVELAVLLLDPRVRDARATAEAETAIALMDRPTWRQRLAFVVELPAALWESFRNLRLPDRHSWRRLMLAYKWNVPLILGTLIVGTLVFIALFAPALAPLNPYKMNAVWMKSAKEWIMPPFPPSSAYPLGSDLVGRDVLSRVIYGTRYTLLIALLIVPLRMLIAVPLGLAAGWLRGRWEWFVTRAAVVLGAVPALMLQAVLVSTIFPPPMAQSLGNPKAPQPDPFLVLMLHTAVLVFFGWPRMAESIRLQTRAIAARPFVEGARAVGATPARLMFRHFLPHLVPALAVSGAAEVAWVMMLMVQLGTFGIWLGGATNLVDFGLVAQYPDWSQMLAYPTKTLFSAPWILLVPAIAFVVAILGFNLLAEGIRRAQQDS